MGKIKEDVPSSAKLIAVVGSQALDGTSSNDIILNEESSVKNNISDNDANNSDSGLKFTFSRALNNEKIQKAEAMEKELEDEYDKGYREMLIWEETGLIRDPSGVWVYEIDDGKMRFYPRGDRFKKRKIFKSLTNCGF
ncbi:MAG: hypothetical protein IJD00_05505 [Clostridia bacterium]|nr:hypothetical protein [Clostridia bacterium]